MQKLECVDTDVPPFNHVCCSVAFAYLQGILGAMTATCLLRQVDATRQLAEKHQHLIA